MFLRMSSYPSNQIETQKLLLGEWSKQQPDAWLMRKWQLFRKFVQMLITVNLLHGTLKKIWDYVKKLDGEFCLSWPAFLRHFHWFYRCLWYCTANWDTLIATLQQIWLVFNLETFWCLVLWQNTVYLLFRKLPRHYCPRKYSWRRKKSCMTDFYFDTPMKAKKKRWKNFTGILFRNLNTILKSIIV